MARRGARSRGGSSSLIRNAIRAAAGPVRRRLRGTSDSGLVRLLKAFGLERWLTGSYRELPLDAETAGPGPRTFGAEVCHGMHDGQAEDGQDPENHPQLEMSRVGTDSRTLVVREEAPQGDTTEAIKEQKRWVADWARKYVVPEDERDKKFTSAWEDEIMRRKELVERAARAHINKHRGGDDPSTAQFMGLLSVEEVSKVFVKESILHAESSYDLLQRVELLIDSDWLVTVDELPGNIYRMNAFNEFIPQGKSVTMGELISARSRQAGFAMILLIQFFGPPLVFFSTFGVGIAQDKQYNYSIMFESETDHFHDWKHIASTKCLGLVFMFAFVLNACYVALDESDTFRKIYSTFSFLKENTPAFKVSGHNSLLFGAFMDCWVVLWCSVDAFLIIGASRTPKDLLLDALGLIFLYNLDDIGGDFGFVDEDDWAGKRLGWVYDEMVEWQDPENEDKKGYKLANQNELNRAQEDRAIPVEVGIYVYNVTAGICAFLAIAETITAIFVPFLLIAPDD